MNYQENKNLHNYIKKNYENGQYSRDYTYHGPYSHNNSENDEKISDFKRGCEKYQQDKNNGHIKSWYYAPIIRILNKIFVGKMQEVVDFIDGYQYEKKKNN
ncbi:hypothetical protein FPFC_061050 [Fructobacillus pseudoficulneus]|uniref:Uncharacterized protein n=1 Tax=Fructobacillus pseudoficulneus TaxID=220714 RepID=A0A3F3GZQ7_9LACO|nr:hypothetical protein [Fructobacillus pseudoficulneus]GAP03382.1 hypothetical protein FPFC_061050 [Fructobacillus pseudoficulneus]SEH43599.1 hypothetical protein SAMN05660469_1047 [Fructobacillus pseudoficulneus]